MATVRKTPFELAGADGRPLRGEVRTAASGGGRPAVVICHGFKGFKDWGMFPHLAERLARAGFTAVSFNFSGSGVGTDGESFSEPERFAHDTYTRQLLDLSGVLEAVKAANLVPEMARPSEIGLLGHSRGGGIAIVKTVEDSEIRALVTWASISQPMRWPVDTVRQWRKDGKLDVVNSRTGQVLPLSTDILDDIERHEKGRLDIRTAAANVRVPWLIIHGGADEAVPVEEARALEQASRGRGRLKVIETGGHTLGARHPWQGSTPDLEEALDATVEWFAKELR
jgi:uncharacterized protein